jgi:hypothetical protein
MVNDWDKREIGFRWPIEAEGPQTLCVRSCAAVCEVLRLCVRPMRSGGPVGDVQRGAADRDEVLRASRAWLMSDADARRCDWIVTQGFGIEGNHYVEEDLAAGGSSA